MAKFQKFKMGQKPDFAKKGVSFAKKTDASPPTGAPCSDAVTADELAQDHPKSKRAPVAFGHKRA